MQEVQEQIEAVLDNDATIYDAALTFNDLHQPVETTLESNYLLNVRILLDQVI